MPARLYGMLPSEGALSISPKPTSCAPPHFWAWNRRHSNSGTSFVRATGPACACRATRLCHFLHEGGCSIHPAKPTQCRIFPFWPELVESRREWLKVARGYCPGIGKGPLIQIEVAREQAREMRAAYPGIYK